MIGTSIGQYQILAELGRGGMGEVYRARDAKLNRDVALKILSDAFVTDPDRLARFHREAQVLASLNHPNIAAIYGFEDSGATHALVLELVEGPTLADLIVGGRGFSPGGDAGHPETESVSSRSRESNARQARGGGAPRGLSIDDSLHIARQIIDALECAHDSGIVHRDLKPANVKVRDDGTVKVLDFGLAKALDHDGGRTFRSGDAGSKDPASYATMTSPAMTAMGMILGTAAYMSPEQAKGKPVDKRADIWAFGCVLYEMLAGRRAFEGDDVSTTLATVLMREPDLAALPARTPASIRALISRCLEKDPRRRLRDIGDARLAFSETELAAAPASTSALTAVASPVSRAVMAGLAVVAVGSTAAALWLWQSTRATTDTSVPTNVSISLPPGHGLVSGPVISRDGRQIVFVSSDGVGRPQLFVRSLDESEPRLIAGTEEAYGPFFSPGGQWVAFYARNKLFKVKLDGGAPVPLADSLSSNGGTWTDDGSIIFNKTWNGGLDVVSENGGPPKTLIAPDRADEYSYAWPYAIPGGREILFAKWGTSFHYVRFDLATGVQTVVAQGWRKIVHTPTGHLVIVNDAFELAAARLSGANGTSGEPVPLVKDVDAGLGSGDARFDVSQNGTLLYVRNERRRSLVTVDRRGEIARVPVGDGAYTNVSVAADGRRAAVNAGRVLSIVDLERGVATRLVPELDAKTGSRSDALWGPGDGQITFGSNHEGGWDLYAKAASGGGVMTSVLKQPRDQFPSSYASDGTLLFISIEPQTGADLWMLPRGGKAVPWLATAAEEVDGQFSPDGRVVAYASNASSRSEIYIQSRTNASDRLQVSAAGGERPVWSPLGDKLYFRQGNVMMEATIRAGGSLSASTPVRLFNGGWALAQWFPYAVMPKGERFLMIEQAPEAIATKIDVVLNWFTTLKDRVR